MTDPRNRAAPLEEVAAYYATFAEERRLESGESRLEFERTKDLLERVLPPAPARVIDVGGAAGAYSFWLAERGYETHLVDAAPRLIEEARRRNANRSNPVASISVADARHLPQEDGSAGAVLVMGPLYHLPNPIDRMAALREAYRVLTTPGVLAVAAISRYASALDGMVRNLTVDPRFVAMRNRDLDDGQHRNETERVDYFTTAYFHRPEDLCSELKAAGFTGVQIFGVEGPGWLLGDFQARWEREAQRQDLMDVARRLEAEPSVLGVSAHLLGVAAKR